ncbi:MAG TPA: methionyl-tRNA formyltransferase [Terriglobales bacterium]|nr:methionyl-tRNA formyltransferase [Terriglobales bacterium]
MRVVFCGTPQFAVPSLRALLDSGFEIPLVVSQPDRPSGRGMQITPTPVKELALSRGVEVMQPEKIKNNQEFRARLEAIRPDAIVVVAYGRIIPQWMIDLPRFGNINGHASLLPKYRGAAPIQWAIAMGETVTGVTTMRIDAGLDTGDMLLKRELPITADDTALTIAPKLAQITAELLVETLRGLEDGTVTPTPQDHSEATLAPILKKEDGQIDFQRTATDIWNRLRGFQPWPGAYCTYRGKKLSVTAARSLPSGTAVLEAGELRVDCGQMLVGCGQLSTLELLEVQPEGKKRMSAKDFLNGYKPTNGERLQ